MDKQELSEFYRQLDERSNAILDSFLDLNGDFDYWVGWYNEHYSRNEKNEYEFNYFPIPIITLDKIAEIEINPEETTIYTYFNARKAREINFDRFIIFNVEAYVVDDNELEEEYTDFGKAAKPSKKKPNNNKDICFAFIFKKDVEARKIGSFIQLLINLGFHNEKTNGYKARNITPDWMH